MPNNANHKIVAVIPAYNEEKTICWVVLSSLKYLDKVIVVDDGSTDMTAEIAKKCGAIVIQHKTNLGKGAALRTGFNEALKRGATIIVTLDADGQHNPRDIPKIVAPILNDNAEVVIGSRFIEDSDNDDMPKYRKIGNKLLNFITLPWKRNITDTQSGFRAYTRGIVKELDVKADNIGVDSQVLMELTKEDHKIVEVPISCQYRDLETSTYNPIRHTLSVISSILVYVTEDRPLFFLGIPAIIFLFISIGFFLHLLDIFNRTRYFSIEIALLGFSALFTGLIFAIAALILFAIGRTIIRLIQKNLEIYSYKEYKEDEEQK